MLKLNQQPLRIIYLAVIGMIIFGCDPNSLGSKDTEQLNNDHDPTNIEIPRDQDNRQLDSFSNMDDDGEFVVIQDFGEEDWVKFREDRNLEAISNSSFNHINAQNSGAESWKPWEGHQYRIVYFSEEGSLKARAHLMTPDNREIEVSNTTLDSLNIQELRNEIQRSLDDVSANHKRIN